MPRLVLHTTQGRGSTQQSHAYLVDTHDEAQMAAQQLQARAVLHGEEPVTFEVLTVERLPE